MRVSSSTPSLQHHSSSVSRVSRAGHTAREEIETARAHIRWRCLAIHQIANCALQPVVFAHSWKTTSNRQVFRTSTNCGTPRDTAEYLCLASDVRQRHVSFWNGRNLGVGRKCQLESLSVFVKVQCETCLQPSCGIQRTRGCSSSGSR